MAWSVDQSLGGAGTGAAVGSAIAPGIGTVIGAGIGFLAPIVAGWIGDALASGDKQKARDLMQQVVDEYGPEALKVPELAALTPHLGPSKMESVYADPRAVQAQVEALNEMQRASRADNLEFRAAANAAEDFANQQAGAQQGAIQQQLQARGMGGSGVDFALRQQAGQNAANRAAQQGFSAAMEGRRQALDSLQNYGSMAERMRGQSFGEGAARANAADAVAKFNEMGRVAGSQQDFENRFGVTRAKTGAMGQQAGYLAGEAAQTRQDARDMGAGVGQAAGAVGQFFNSQGGGQAPSGPSFGNYGGSGRLEVDPETRRRWGGG